VSCSSPYLSTAVAHGRYRDPMASKQSRPATPDNEPCERMGETETGRAGDLLCARNTDPRESGEPMRTQNHVAGHKVPKSLVHVTLTTGHERLSRRTEVMPATMPVVTELLAGALSGTKAVVPMPGPKTLLTAFASGRDLLVTVRAAGGNPLATVGVSPGPGEALWRSLHDGSALPIVTRPDRPPSGPWCAARLELGLVSQPGAAMWLGDFERCVAWVWLEQLMPRRPRAHQVRGLLGRPAPRGDTPVPSGRRDVAPIGSGDPISRRPWMNTSTV
jgi:hypothetical protein